MVRNSLEGKLVEICSSLLNFKDRIFVLFRRKKKFFKFFYRIIKIRFKKYFENYLFYIFIL